MITLEKVLIKTHYYLVNSISDDGVLYQKMVFLGVTFWVSVSTLYLAIAGFVKKVFFFFSVEGDKKFQMNDSKKLSSSQEENFQFDSATIEPLADTEPTERRESDMIELKNSDIDEEEPSKLVFKFEYQTKTFEQFRKGRYRGEDNDSFSDSILSSSIASKHETKPLKDPIGFIDKPEVVSFSVEDLYSESVNDSIKNKRFLSEEDFLQEKSAQVKTDDSFLFTQEDLTVKAGQKISAENQKDDFSEKFQFLSENDFIETTDTDSGTIDSSHEFTSRFVASTSDGFFSDSDFEEDLFEPGEASTVTDSENDSNEGKNGKNTEQGLDFEDDSNGLESLWEHQDLIEQLKMELKKVRTIGLPTILEDESECPKIMEDLKPWKIDEKKFQHVDRIGELHKFYKSYRERMRKFDILNYQKMYALGLLQSKDPLQAISTVKSSPPPTITSVLASNLRLWKPRKSETDPMVKFVKELHSELENVYVGQLCLSWEILHWQYEKALELWESDSYGIRRYNEVAGEFQQFQVLIQRFLENELFEGPRVQNYVKKRCVLRNLLQVPVIREDSNKDKKKARTRVGEGVADDAITSDKLVEIMEESIRLFWRFVLADKHSNSTLQKTLTKSQIQPEDPQGLEMFAEIKAALQKKEKKLKDVLRSGNCILRKFQKHHAEDGSEQVFHFFSQVDMRLVARVLNMSKLTRDHLMWCHSKLSKINFVNRRIHVEPSFCLFPC